LRCAFSISDSTLWPLLNYEVYCNVFVIILILCLTRLVLPATGLRNLLSTLNIFFPPCLVFELRDYV